MEILHLIQLISISKSGAYTVLTVKAALEDCDISSHLIASTYFRFLSSREFCIQYSRVYYVPKTV